MSTLSEILQEREERVALQQALLKEHRAPLISFTMNIAGPVKTSPLIERAFDTGLATLENRLPQEKVLARRIDRLPTGCRAMYAVMTDADFLKTLCTAIEEESSVGRLFDMDVLDTNGIKLERKNLRSCLVCGAAGRGCAAGRLHSVEELQTVTAKIITDHFLQADSLRISKLAEEALLREVETTPKPGLVDRRNNGSHTDMTPETFIASASALRPYFEECVKLGQKTANCAPEETFPLLRKAGLAAEKKMYQATNGINTHKGAIYTMGILCGALGRLWQAEHPIAPTSDLLAQAALLVKASAPADFAVGGETAGHQLYRQYGLTGIRGEVAAGLPSVKNIALPAYEKALADGLSSNDAGVLTLLHLIAAVKDTNLYHRGGIEGAAYAAQAARALLGRTPTPAELEALDDAFIARNLSPGGCADLLAVTYFLHALNK